MAPNLCGAFCGRWVLWSCEDAELQRQLGRNATTEPLVLVISSADSEKFRVIQQRPWRDGLQVECLMQLDNEPSAVPKPLCLGDKDTWRHKFSDGAVHSEHKTVSSGKDIYLRSKLLLRHSELVEEIQLYEGPSEKSIASGTRVFQRNPFKTSWKAAAAQFFSGTDVEKNLQTCISWMRKAKEQGADLVVMPENSNRDRSYFKDGKPSRAMCWEHSETLEGAFVSGVRRACRDLGLWTSLGVDLRGKREPDVHIGIVLIRPDGDIEGVVKKHVLWDYEYTLFEPGEEPYQVFDTELGRLGLLCCADGIVPEAARVLSLMGAQVLLNSLNSRGPDEMRVHIPLRAIENGVWHVASNTVGNPNTMGLLWPWTGGSEVCDPKGQRVVASEEHDDMVLAEVRPMEAEIKRSSWAQDIWACRRPDLYGLMMAPLEAVPAAKMYGPAPEVLPFPGPDKLKVAMMQLSATHTKKCSEWMMQRQVSYAARRGAVLGVLPSLWCFRCGEVSQNPQQAANYSCEVLEKLKAWAKESAMFLCCSLVEEENGNFFHSAYLIGSAGTVLGTYRKTHLGGDEATWATPGDHRCEVISDPALGRVAMMISDEVWSPEVSRCLALAGAEVVLHPADWDILEAGEMAATERATENRFHLVSVNRLDSPGRLGSQTTLAGEYIGGEPIPLMRYGQGIWCRYGVEEQVIVELPRRQAHCKMMGDHLDVLKKRAPALYSVCCKPKEELYGWRQMSPDLQLGKQLELPRQHQHCRFSEDFS